MRREKGKKIFLIGVSLVFFLSLIFYFQAGSVFSRETIAKLSISEGEVELIREGEIIPISLGMSLLSGDRINTKGGFAEVVLPDGSLLKIYPNSNVTFVWADPTTGAVNVNVFAGKADVTSAGETVTVTEGEATTIVPGEAPSEPAPPPAGEGPSSPPPLPPPPPVPPASPSE
jgi:hypothetical protein